MIWVHSLSRTTSNVLEKGKRRRREIEDVPMYHQALAILLKGKTETCKTRELGKEYPARGSVVMLKTSHFFTVDAALPV